jgi:hypothetical protein
MPKGGRCGKVQDLIKNRFVSTIKESVADNQVLLDIPEFRNCARKKSKFTTQDLADEAALLKIEQSAKDCFQLEIK